MHLETAPIGAPSRTARTARPRGRLLAVLVGLAVFAVAGLGFGGVASAAPRTATALTAPVTGTLADGTGAVNGTFAVQSFQVQNGVLQALGTFTGTITDAAGTTTSGTQSIALPVDLAQSTGSCTILDLTLGPLHLDLLGLVVDLNQVHLTITAQQGPGNLLGNLLCAVANLLNGPTGLNAILDQLAALLNQLLAGL